MKSHFFILIFCIQFCEIIRFCIFTIEKVGQRQIFDLLFHLQNHLFKVPWVVIHSFAAFYVIRCIFFLFVSVTSDFFLKNGRTQYSGIDVTGLFFFWGC